MHKDREEVIPLEISNDVHLQNISPSKIFLLCTSILKKIVNYKK